MLAVKKSDPRQVKTLRDINVREISGVTKAANPRARVMILKRDAEALGNDIPKTAAAVGHRLWNEGLANIMKAADCSMNEAITVALRDPTLAGAFRLSQGLSVADVCKLGSGTGIPERKPNTAEYQDASGRVVSATVDSGHFAGHPDPTQPHNYTSSTESGDEALARLRGQHNKQQVRRFNTIMDAQLAAGKSKSDALECALRECPDVRNMSAADMLSAQTDAESDARQLRTNGSNQSSST